MAAKIVNRGLLRIGQQASESTNYNAARNIQTMAVDDRAVAFAAGDNNCGSPSNFFDKTLDATPTEPGGQTIRHIATLPTGSANFTIRRISLHDDTVGNVSGSSNTLVGGVDSQSLTKTSDFSLEITIDITYADAS